MADTIVAEADHIHGDHNECGESSSIIDCLSWLSGDGSWQDGGDVESPQGWFALIVVDDRLRDLHPALQAEAYVLRIDNYGFKDYDPFDNEDEAQQAFDSLNNEYGEWLSSVDDEDDN